MWDWFTANSIWYLTGCALVFILTVIGRNMFRDRLAKLKPEKRDARSNSIINRSLIIIIYIQSP